MSETGIFSAVSPDGSQIACGVTGRGPALLLVHGTADDRLGFDRIAPLLSSHYTLYMMDRRGRGLSTNQAADYAIEREFEDINALADAIAAQHGAPANLFAHSYGALCAMGAARAATNIGRIMLYEPPPGTPSTLVDRMVAADKAGDLEGVMHVQFVELQHLPEAQFERLKSDAKRWDRYLGFAGTIAREFVNARRFSLSENEFVDHTQPVRFIIGEKTFPPLIRYTESALRAFPHADNHIIPGQGHNALRQAPELVAAEIERFFV